MKIHAYLRVSTEAQDAENQYHGVNEYATERGMTVNEIINDTESGATLWRDRKLNALLNRMHLGDVLLVAEISRIGRSTHQVLDFLQEAAKKQIIVHIVKSSLIMDGSMQSKIIATILGLAAEIEREFIRSRTTEALARRRAAGLPMGRPEGEAKTLKLDAQSANLDKWREKKIGWLNMARLAGCSRSTLYAWAARRRPHWLTSGAPINQTEK